MNKKVILVLGPESSGTRITSNVLSQHPEIDFFTGNDGHHDRLDVVWDNLDNDDIKIESENEYILTRRSLPHSRGDGANAKFEDYFNLKKFYERVNSNGMELILIVTIRDPISNLCSWAKNRKSTEGSMDKAYQQYKSATLYIFDFIKNNDVNFIISPLESLVLGGEDYINSIFNLIGLKSVDLSYETKGDVNKKHYEWFKNNEFKITSS